MNFRHFKTITIALMLLPSLGSMAQGSGSDIREWDYRRLLHETAWRMASADKADDKSIGMLRSELSRRMGEEKAVMALSEVFERGDGVSEQPKMAFTLLKDIANKKTFYKNATYEYACMLLDGYGCQPDVGTAVQLLIKCAEAGHKPALRELSLALKENGLTVSDGYLQMLIRESNHYDSFRRMPNGYIQVERDARHGIIDRDGKCIIRPIYDEPIHYKTEGLTKVERNGRYGFVSAYGTEIISPRYASAGEFSEGVAIVYDDDGWAILSADGSERLIDAFDAVGDFSDGLAVVKRDGKQGAIDHNGNVVIPPHFEEITPFACGLAAVRSGKHWGYIDHKGEVVIPFRYDSAKPFVNPQKPFALVAYKGKEMCIDRKGKKTKVKL